MSGKIFNKDYAFLNVTILFMSLFWFFFLWQLDNNLIIKQLNVFNTSYILVVGLFFIPFSFLAAHYISLTIFSSFEYFFLKKIPVAISSGEFSVAILYPTCNDFDPVSLQSCIAQDLNKFSVYILDDSSSDSKKNEIDSFVNERKLYAACDISVIRREGRKGAKAGNINNALKYVNEDFCIICDADQFLEPDFGRKILSHIESNENIAYVQGLHHPRKNSSHLLPTLLRDGIYLFWAIVLPIRQNYGFPMFLGHGGIIRTSILKLIKFPEIVAEDLGFSVACYELGYVGKYATNVFSYESFPDTVRDFRKRHMKWVRGTCEFLKINFKSIVFSKKLKLKHKWDILSSLIQVPFGLGFVIFGLLNFTFLAGFKFNLFDDYPFLDNMLINYLAMLISISPFLPFAVPLVLKRRFYHLFIFYVFGVSIYVATIPITFWGMLGYFMDGKADFITTGDASSDKSIQGLRNPNSILMFCLEILLGFIFCFAGLAFQLWGAFGLGLSFLLFPFLCLYDLSIKNVVFSVIGPFFTLYALAESLLK